MNPSPCPDPADVVRHGDAVELSAAWPANPPMLIEVRHCVRDWLRSRRWPAVAAAEIEHAVNEAATNVVQHAYPPGYRTGLIELCAWTCREMFAQRGERAVITITDTGRGWPGPPRAAEGDLHTHTGLAIIRAFTHEHYIRTSDAGTRIILITHARPSSGLAARRA